MQSPSFSPITTTTTSRVEVSIDYSTMMWLNQFFHTPRRWMMMGQHPQQLLPYHNETLTDVVHPPTITPSVQTILSLYDTWQEMTSSWMKQMLDSTRITTTNDDHHHHHHHEATAGFWSALGRRRSIVFVLVLVTVVATVTVIGCYTIGTWMIHGIRQWLQQRLQQVRNNPYPTTTKTKTTPEQGDTGTTIRRRNGHSISKNKSFSFWAVALSKLHSSISSFVSLLLLGHGPMLLQNIYIALRVYFGLLLLGLVLEQNAWLHVLSQQWMLPSLITSFWMPHLHTTNTNHSSNHSNHTTATVSTSDNASTTLSTAALVTGTCPTTSSAFSGATTTFRCSEAAPMVAFIVWIGMTILSIKRNILLRQQQQQHARASLPNNNNYASSSNSIDTTIATTSSIATATTAVPAPTTIPPKISGRMILLNRLIDLFIYLVMASYMIHEISIDTATSHFLVQSLLSAGGIGALIFSLASKDLAMELVGGMTLGMYDIFHVGDRIRISESNVSGKIIEIGFVETTIQSYDNIITRVPNSQITKSRISNLSRCPRSRLRQNIRIKYSDIEKLPALLIDIKKEIIVSCPKVISDGSKSFHSVVSSFEADHIQVMVLAHFEIPPVTAEYIRNRHDVLLAIHRAMKKHDVDFAIPSIVYSTNSAQSPTNGRDPADYSF